MYYLKDYAKPYSQISFKYLQNRIKIISPVLQYSVENYSTRCSHSAVSIGNNIFPKGIMKIRVVILYGGDLAFRVTTKMTP